MIGDPSGRSAERNLLDRETLEANVAALRGQLERFLDFSPGAGGAVMVNNLDWLGELSLIEFLRDTGKHFTIPYMLAKDSVQIRLERGLSFTEFSYMLLQAYDFAHLHRTMGVELQMGGADQWGNITAGLELIRRRAGMATARRTASGPIRPTAWPTSSCCRRRGRSSARARRRVGLAGPGADDARTRSTSTGSTRTTATSGRTCAGSRSSSRERDRGARGRSRDAARGAGGPAGAGPRHHGARPTARGGDRGGDRAIREAMFSSAADRRSRRCWPRSSPRRRVHVRPGDARGRDRGPAGGRRRLSPRAARRAG